MHILMCILYILGICYNLYGLAWTKAVCEGSLVRRRMEQDGGGGGLAHEKSFPPSLT